MTEPINMKTEEFQKWCEKSLVSAMEKKPTCIAIVSELADGSCTLTYFNADATDLRLMGHELFDAALMEVIRANTGTEDYE